MAEQAANIAQTLGIQHVTMKLPWGQTGCPPKPGPDAKIEELARDMRQMVLFNQMKRFSANALASGHHADDQVETMLMRMGRGSSQLGLAGMRYCRRWGMGTGGEMNDKLYGIDGMRTWMVRPLLDVPKVSLALYGSSADAKLPAARIEFLRHVNNTNSNMLPIQLISSHN
jgi:tRNA(Ile)-lysidine synthase